MRRIVTRALPCVVLAATLGACTAPMSEDLDSWTAQATSSARRPLEAVPHVSVADLPRVDVGAMNDPFALERLSPGRGGATDTNRPREALEAFPLGSLSLVGVMSTKSDTSGVILADGVMYQVRVGNHIGPAGGRVAAITPSTIEIVEGVEDNRGQWVEKTTVLRKTGTD